MKLIKARVTDYRNILDSNEVEIGVTTCLVGKNEAGKTAFLKALEGLRSTDASFRKYGRTENYPRRFLADYRARHPSQEARVLWSEWELSDEDIAQVESELGKGALTGRTAIIEKSYEHDFDTWTVPVDGRRVLDNLLNRHALDSSERAALEGVTLTAQALRKLEALHARTERQHQLLATIRAFRDGAAHHRAADILAARTPKFLYFSHYDRMSGELSISKLYQDRKQNTLDSGDRVFLDFLEYAGTTLEELTSATRFEDLNARCEAAAIRITDQIFEYWTQNDDLRIRVVLSEGKSGDPPPFNAGPVVRARVENMLHGVTVPFSERSAGFIWFFSFLVKFAQIKKNQGNVILLLDDPGLTLHGTAQKDLLRYFAEQIAPHHQLIYTTHSPFMIPADHLGAVRTVEDVVTRDWRDRKISLGAKIRSDVLTADAQSIFPLLGAMGFEVIRKLAIGSNVLLVEAPSDVLYLQAASAVLKDRRKPHLSAQWVVCPSGGIERIMPFVRLFQGNALNIAVLTDYGHGQRRKLEDLMKSQLLEQECIALVTEFAGKDEADIEDFFPPEFFVELVNRTYALSGSHALKVDSFMDADWTTARLVQKVEAHFRLLPPEVPEFSHYDPALYLLHHPELWRELPRADEALARFEAAFLRIGKFLAQS